MNYTVVISERARKDIAALSEQMKERVKKAAYALVENPRPHGVKKLQGMDSYRVRVGDYRVIYEIADAVKIVTIERVAHRADAYRN
jgi:mRNA interferase RelE/StbE